MAHIKRTYKHNRGKLRMAYELDHQHGDEYHTPTIYCDKPHKFTIFFSPTIQNQSWDRIKFFLKQQQPKAVQSFDAVSAKLNRENVQRTEQPNLQRDKPRSAVTVQTETIIVTQHEITLLWYNLVCVKL